MTMAGLHLATVLPCAFIGAWLLATRKGTPVHKALGRLYVALILSTALLTLGMPSEVGPRIIGHLGIIHGLSIAVLVFIPLSVLAARSGRVRTHRYGMLGVYTGSILVAGLFAFTPGRLLHRWWFGQAPGLVD